MLDQQYVVPNWARLPDDPDVDNGIWTAFRTAVNERGDQWANALNREVDGMHIENVDIYHPEFDGYIQALVAHKPVIQDLRCHKPFEGQVYLLDVRDFRTDARDYWDVSLSCNYDFTWTYLQCNDDDLLCVRRYVVAYHALGSNYRKILSGFTMNTIDEIRRDVAHDQYDRICNSGLGSGSSFFEERVTHAICQDELALRLMSERFHHPGESYKAFVERVGII